MYGQNNDGDRIREFEKFENKTIKILGFLSVHCYQLVNNKESVSYLRAPAVQEGSQRQQLSHCGEDDHYKHRDLLFNL